MRFQNQAITFQCHEEVLSNNFIYNGNFIFTNIYNLLTQNTIFSSDGFRYLFAEQFYLVDSGYPNIPGFLSPYRGQRYHLRDYNGQGRLRGKEDLFNYKHSSCRNIIERCIGVLKARFPILKLMTNFPLSRQRQIPIACCTIHNFIREEHALDTLFAEYSSENMIFQSTLEPNHEQEVVQFNVSQTTQMGQVRDQLAAQMWNEYVTTHHI